MQEVRWWWSQKGRRVYVQDTSLVAMKAVIDYIETKTHGNKPTFWERLGWVFGIRRELEHTLTMRLSIDEPLIKGMIIRDKVGRHKWLVVDFISLKHVGHRALVKNIKPMNGKDWSIYWILKNEGKEIEFK